MHFAGYHTKVDLATDALAERSKAVAQGAIPKGRGFEPHSCHFHSTVDTSNISSTHTFSLMQDFQIASRHFSAVHLVLHGDSLRYLHSKSIPCQHVPGYKTEVIL